MPGSEVIHPGAEGVMVLQTPITQKRTTYYAQEDPVAPKKPVAGYESVSDESEKTSVLQTPIAATRTTFYPKNTKQKASFAQRTAYKDYDKEYNKRQWVLAQE